MASIGIDTGAVGGRVNRVEEAFKQLLRGTAARLLARAPVQLISGRYGHQGVESNDLVLTASNDLRIGVAPQKQVRHKRFPEHEGTHLRVWLIVEQQVQRMVKSFFLAAVVRLSVKVQRQSRNGFRQNADAGIDRRHLHGGAFRYRFAGGRAAEKESVIAARCAVLRLVS